MTFREGEADTFLAIFHKSAEHIRAFPGCEFLALHRDVDKQEVFFTYSRWKDAEALEAYRHSDLFQKTWASTKILFAARPEAWSLGLVATLS